METTGPAESRVIGLVQGIVGRARAEALVASVEIDATLLRPPAGTVSRAELAHALNLLLFDDLLRRVPAGGLPAATARRILPDLAGAFDRQHPVPAFADYERLLEESAEAAWISTEGNAFNHATDRVADVAALSVEELSLGRPIKDRVEASASGRVLQTAYRAAPVERPFAGPDGALVLRTVPGSFFELITRHRHADGRLDLAFDTSNAQAIFKMTEAALA
jgi:hypothetical protein